VLATGRWGTVTGLVLLAGAFFGTRRRRTPEQEASR
jgi:LPXTG-motif cell wall-anchored protein